MTIRTAAIDDDLGLFRHFNQRFMVTNVCNDDQNLREVLVGSMYPLAPKIMTSRCSDGILKFLELI